MSTKKYVITLILTLLSVPFSWSQFVDYGTDPARYKWNHVNLPHYHLIYPQGADSMAYRYALYLENVYPHITKHMEIERKRLFPVILHPGNMLSNGMVSWAPRRMELVTTPSSKLESQSWDKHLVLHESRHVAQTSKIMTGIFHPLYYLIGEQSAGIASVLVPQWFFEGDAVGTETAMSNGGRGRLPEFNMIYRTQMLSGDFFPFDKWYLGSYKENTGSYYALGYNMTSFAKQEFGIDIWDKVTSRFVSHILHLPPFSKAMKHYTGYNVNGLFANTFAYLENEWKSIDKKPKSHFTYVSPSTNKYTSYRYPLALNDSTTIAVKSSYNNIHSFISLTNGKENRLTYLGNINSRPTRSHDRIYWSENRPSLRWSHENYSDIKYYDFSSRRKGLLTTKKRYLAPCINREGNRIAVSNPELSGKNYIVVIDATNGEEQTRYATPQNAFVKELAYTDNGDILAIAVDDKGNSILYLETETNKWTTLLSSCSSNITSPVWNDGKLFFESGLDGTNNIYYLDTNDGEIYKATSSRFGGFDPSFSTDNHFLLLSDYQQKGYRIASIPMDSLVYEKVSFNDPYIPAFVESLASQEQFNLDSVELKPISFNPKPYRKGLHLFNVHSWAPLYYDVTELMSLNTDDFRNIIKPGIQILSQNALNTVVTQAAWYIDKGYHHGKVSLSYTGWFPIIDIKADYGGRAFDMSWTKEGEENVMKGNYTNRHLLDMQARVYLPFNLTKGHYIRGIQPSLIYSFTNNRYQQLHDKQYKNYQYLLSELRFYNYRQMARQEVLPRWGYQLRLQLLHTPFNTENYGNIYATRLTTYWPSIIRGHSFMLRLGYQYQDVDKKSLYLPQQIMETSRGYSYIYQTRQQIAAKADYAFTLAYPDVNLGSIAYLKRLRSNLFYDMSLNQEKKGNSWAMQSSVGLDLIADWNAIRMTHPLSLGIRLIQPIDYGSFQVSGLFSLSF